MSEAVNKRHLVDIETDRPVWDRFFIVAPLVLIGTTDADASPRQAGHKPVLDYITTFSARLIEGAFIEEAYLYFECRHFKSVDGFGPNCLITGEIVAACAEPGFLRSSELDDQEIVHDSPLRTSCAARARSPHAARDWSLRHRMARWHD